MAILRDEDWELVTLVLDGEIEEQNPLFREWLLSDKSHPALYEELKQVKTQIAGSGKYHAFESTKQEMWERVKSEAFESRPVIKIGTWWKYAAALILAGILTAWFAYFNPMQTGHQTSDKPAIYAYSQKATLHLSDGTVIDLDKEKKLNEKDGTLLNAGKSTGLQYIKAGVNTEAPVSNTLVTGKGGAYQVTLSDGTRVWLNAVSELSYPTRFTGAQREVELTGEAYFEVAKDAAHPFIVKTATSKTLVTGTHFNIYAYREEPVIATLVEGGITFSGENEASGDVKLFLSQQAVQEKMNGNIKVKNVDTELYTSWKQGGLFFENERLDILLRKLDRWYDFRVDFRETPLKDLRFTGRADKSMSIDYILQLVSLTTHVRFTIEGRTITVNKK